MCDRNESLKIRDEAYLLCKEVFGDKLTDCYLYGSYARGDYNEESDIDIMMVIDLGYEELNKLRYRISHICSDLSLKYEITISVKLQPKAILERYKDVVPYYQNVLREGIKYGI